MGYETHGGVEHKEDWGKVLDQLVKDVEKLKKRK